MHHEAKTARPSSSDELYEELGIDCWKEQQLDNIREFPCRECKAEGVRTWRADDTPDAWKFPHRARPQDVYCFRCRPRPGMTSSASAQAAAPPEEAEAPNEEAEMDVEVEQRQRAQLARKEADAEAAEAAEAAETAEAELRAMVEAEAHSTGKKKKSRLQRWRRLQSGSA